MPELDRSKLSATSGALATQRQDPGSGEVRVWCPGGCERSTVRPDGRAAASRREAYRIEHGKGWHDATA